MDSPVPEVTLLVCISPQNPPNAVTPRVRAVFCVAGSAHEEIFCIPLVISSIPQNRARSGSGSGSSLTNADNMENRIMYPPTLVMVAKLSGMQESSAVKNAGILPCAVFLVPSERESGGRFFFSCPRYFFGRMNIVVESRAEL